MKSGFISISNASAIETIREALRSVGVDLPELDTDGLIVTRPGDIRDHFKGKMTRTTVIQITVALRELINSQPRSPTDEQLTKLLERWMTEAPNKPLGVRACTCKRYPFAHSPEPWCINEPEPRTVKAAIRDALSTLQAGDLKYSHRHTLTQVDTTFSAAEIGHCQSNAPQTLNLLTRIVSDAVKAIGCKADKEQTIYDFARAGVIDAKIGQWITPPQLLTEVLVQMRGARDRPHPYADPACKHKSGTHLWERQHCLRLDELGQFRNTVWYCTHCDVAIACRNAVMPVDDYTNIPIS